MASHPNNHYWSVCSKLGKQHSSFLSKLGINEFHCQFLTFKQKRRHMILNYNNDKKKNPDTVRMPKGPENSNKGLPLFYKQSITQTPDQTHSTLLKLCHITTLHIITAFGINGWGPTNQLLK